VQHFSLSIREPNNIFLWHGPTLLRLGIHCL
jgi:hypothetical protein